ncbi:hypothetical protein ES703_81666 [subsurface metagenome]
MDGGQFFGDDIVYIERIGLHNFKITLTTNEYNQVKDISECDNISIEQAFANAIETGLFTEEKAVKEKE